MRKMLGVAVSVGLLGLCVYLQADPLKNEDDALKVRVKLVDADTGKAIPGIIRVFGVGEEKPLALPGLYDRLRGLKTTATLAGWSVVPAAGGATTLPRRKVRIEAVSGLETALAVEEVDLSKNPPAEVTVKLKSLFRPEQSDLVAGNTHLHLMNLTAEDSDEYLKQVPAADRLKVLFISYLERIKEDVTYITNRLPIGDQKQFNATGVLVNNGEEHRHNFGERGEGYGHVMFLNINRLVKPVSLGSGITGGGNDDQPLRPGIEDARKQGGTVLWCHNASGFESVSNTLAGRIDALNVFDGTRTGTYEDSYYRYLNIGMRFPISTGTDWFLYDFSRVYAKVPGQLTIPKWLDALKTGRCQVTNSPLITLTVDGKDIGDVLNLEQPKALRVEVTATGRHDFQILQLVQNGRVIQTEPGKMKDGICTAKLSRVVRLDEPAWFAARIDSTANNELNRQLFAHTSPIYVDFAGKRVFDVETARLMLRRMEEAKDEIRGSWEVRRQRDAGQDPRNLRRHGQGSDKTDEGAGQVARHGGPAVEGESGVRVSLGHFLAGAWIDGTQIMNECSQARNHRRLGTLTPAPKHAKLLRTCPPRAIPPPKLPSPLCRVPTSPRHGRYLAARSSAELASPWPCPSSMRCNRRSEPTRATFPGASSRSKRTWASCRSSSSRRKKARITPSRRTCNDSQSSAINSRFSRV